MEERRNPTTHGRFSQQEPGVSLPFLLRSQGMISCAAGLDWEPVAAQPCRRAVGTKTPLPFIRCLYPFICPFGQIPKPQISVLEEMERFLPQHRKQTVHCLCFKADCTTHKNRARGKYPPLFPDKTSIIHKSQMHFFSLFILVGETKKRFNCFPHLVHIHST